MTSIPACTFAILATQYGLGTPDSELNDELRARASLYLSYWLVSYTVSTNLAKTGIAAALLRLTTLRRYRYPIYAIMVSTPLFVLGMIVVMVYTCRPLGAQFDPDLGPCPTRHFMADFSYAFTGVTVTLDWACAIIPYLLLRDLQMLLRTKISLLALLTFGGLAGVCALIRVPYLRYYYINEDQLCALSLPQSAASPQFSAFLSPFLPVFIFMFFSSCSPDIFLRKDDSSDEACNKTY